MQCPMMDYEEIVCQEDAIVVIAASSQLIVAGTERGEVRILGGARHLLGTEPIRSVSVDGASFAYCDQSRVAVVPEGSAVPLELGPVDPVHFPLNCVAISPDYHVTRRLVVGGATGDLLVLSQQGEPFPSSSLSRTNVPGPVTCVSWRSDFLVYSGTQFGVRILNTTSGNKIYHLPNTEGYVHHQFLTSELVLIQTKLTVRILRISLDNACSVVQTISFPSTSFADDAVMSELLAAIGTVDEREKILGFGLFDETELSLTMVTRAPCNSLMLHVVDVNCRDIAVSEKITSSVGNCVFAFIPATVPFALLSTGANRITKITRRSIEDHCMWLLDMGEFEKALDLAAGTSIDLHVANKALVPLIEAGAFARVVSLIPHLGLTKDRWSIFLNHFLSLPSGPLLAQSLAAILPAIPFPPRDELVLEIIDYDKLINTVLRNCEWSAFELLETVRRWPASIYSFGLLQEALIDLVPEDFMLTSAEKAQFLPRGITGFPFSDTCYCSTSRTIALIIALKVVLFERITDSLDILLRLRCSVEIFDSLTLLVHLPTSVKEWVETNIRSLFQLDPKSTALFIVSRPHGFPLDEMELDPFPMHVLLREAFFKDPKCTVKWYRKQVSLFLQFDPQLLPQFVREADENAYSMSEVLEEIDQTGSSNPILIEAKSLLLWKLGKVSEAIELLLTSKDVAKAVDFAAVANDLKIWESILIRVFEVKELVPIFLSALVDLQRKGTVLPIIVKPETILATKFPLKIKSNIIVPLASHILKDLTISSEICAKSTAIVINDYLKKRKSGPHKCAVRIDPQMDLCAICGCRVCAPPPGGAGDFEEHFLDSIVPSLDTSESRFASVGSTLAVVDIASGLCHSTCLHRTTVGRSTVV